jgi:hypothetical protein
MFGAVPGRYGAAEVWLLGSEALVQSPGVFLRGAAAWIPWLHGSHSVLWCKIDARNTAHLRWLAWCGFVATGVLDDFGVEQRRFLCFARGGSSPIGRRLSARRRSC